jgi:hypothetical protein
MNEGDNTVETIASLSFSASNSLVDTSFAVCQIWSQSMILIYIGLNSLH